MVLFMDLALGPRPVCLVSLSMPLKISNYGAIVLD